jgi:outer membrane receptor protein involved in Fe transport
LRASLTGLCLLTLATRAEAAEARRRFAIPSKSYAEALIDLAVQANVSLLGASACGTGGPTALAGRHTLSDALARVLSGAPCTWRIVDAQTVRIIPIGPAPVRAEGPTAPAVAELLVTARKRPERLDSLPAGVSVVSGEQLVVSNAYDARETAGQLVGVLTTNLGPGRDKLLMRGLSDGAFTGRARSTVSTYLDDAPINYNAPDPDLRLVDVEQVETVRGPQGALYGSGALAGVYRIVTNKPDPGGYAAGGAAMAGSTTGGAPSYEGEVYANAPLADGRAAARLVAYYDDQGGYLDNVSLRLSNVDSTVRTGGRLALRLELSDSWTADLTAVGQHLNSRDTQYTTLAARDQRANQVREASVNDFAQGALTLHGELAGADLAATTSYLQHAYSSLYDATQVATQFVSGATLGVYSEAARIRRVVQDVVLTSAGSSDVSWLVGVYGSSSLERTPSALDIVATGGAIPFATAVSQGRLTRVYDEERRDQLQELAAYGETTWRFAPGWTFAAGARAFRSHLDVKANIAGAPPTLPRAIDETSSSSGVSPKLSLQYEFMDEALIYGLYSEGFRPGGVNTTNFVGIKPARTTFEPDRLQNFELGAKGRFLDQRLVVRAAAFYDVWSNIQSDQYRPAPTGLAYTANVGDAHIRGLEAEAAYDWGFGLSVQANALYSAPKFTSVNPDFANTLGSGLPGAPRWSGGLLARYDHALPRDLTLRLLARASYVGPARLTFDPTLSARTDPVIDSELLAELVRRRVSGGVFISNPTDASGNTFAYGNPFTFGQVRQVTPQRPRTFGVRVAAAF